MNLRIPICRFLRHPPSGVGRFWKPRPRDFPIFASEKDWKGGRSGVAAHSITAPTAVINPCHQLTKIQGHLSCPIKNFRCSTFSHSYGVLWKCDVQMKIHWKSYVHGCFVSWFNMIYLTYPENCWNPLNLLGYVR